MALDFIPQVKKLKTDAGVWSCSGSIGISDHSLFPAAKLTRELLDAGSIAVVAKKVKDSITISIDARLKAGGYKLDVTKTGVRLRAKDVRAAFHGVQTLRQLAAQSPKGSLKCVSIVDWPDIEDRGVYYDCARGRIPKLERLKEMVDLLAHYKMNQLQLYIEHTFAFRSNPCISQGVSPLTAEDIMELDEYCRERHVELVPSLATFGHMGSMLWHESLREMAESCEQGNYQSVSPAHPRTYDFLEQLFDEFLPCFTSKRFNVCCDEVYDLGAGQSRKLAEKIGKGRLYLRHIKKLRRLAAKHGKKIMMWGDIIRKYPELIPEIPKDIAVLDWGYNAMQDFGKINDFIQTGLPSHVCPSVCGYFTLFPRIHESMGNIHGWAKAGTKSGAKGMLNTDWGDGGHYNWMECAWPGYVCGGEMSWNCGADIDSFLRRFCRLFLNIESGEFVKALKSLGDVSHLAAKDLYQSFWRHVFFAPADSELFLASKRYFVTGVKDNVNIGRNRVVSAAMGREAKSKLLKVRKLFANEFKKRGVDPHGVGDYWLFSVDALIHAANKMIVLAERGGSDTPANRRKLKAEMTTLRDRFKKLWFARNRKSEISITLALFRGALKGL